MFRYLHSYFFSQSKPNHAAPIKKNGLQELEQCKSILEKANSAYKITLQRKYFAKSTTCATLLLTMFGAISLNWIWYFIRQGRSSYLNFTKINSWHHYFAEVSHTFDATCREVENKTFLNLDCESRNFFDYCNVTTDNYLLDNCHYLHDEICNELLQLNRFTTYGLTKNEYSHLFFYNVTSTISFLLAAIKTIEDWENLREQHNREKTQDVTLNACLSPDNLNQVKDAIKKYNIHIKDDMGIEKLIALIDDMLEKHDRNSKRFAFLSGNLESYKNTPLFNFFSRDASHDATETIFGYAGLERRK